MIRNATRLSPRPAALCAAALAGLLLAAAPASGEPDRRAERPLQLQAELFGLSVGYHFSELIYVGLTQHVAYESTRYDRRYDDDDRLFDQDGVEDVDLDAGRRRSVEIRISPWPFGLYFALGYLAFDGDRLTVDYDERLRIVGSNAYTADLHAEIDEPSYGTGALGIGFNHVFDYGLSVGGGILVGLARPRDADVRISSTNPAIAQADLDAFREEVRDDHVESRALFHLAVGYNF